MRVSNSRVYIFQFSTFINGNFSLLSFFVKVQRSLRNNDIDEKTRVIGKEDVLRENGEHGFNCRLFSFSRIPLFI